MGSATDMAAEADGQTVVLLRRRSSSHGTWTEQNSTANTQAKRSDVNDCLAQASDQRIYRPLIARAMTRRWISLVPSKMV